jgi:hypothetical protein
MQIMDANTALGRTFHPDALYHSLNPGNREILVIRIDSSQPDAADIRCSLEAVSLNSTPVYQARSYE